MALSREERLAKDRERKRLARARERAKRDAEQAAANRVSSDAVPSVMRDAVEATIKAMKWDAGSDAASVAQARLLAEQVDVLTHARSTEKALSAHRALTAVLRDLGAAPVVRLQHELRSRRADPVGERNDDGDDEKSPANVSKFERPAKRRRQA